ncbi:MAG: serine protease [Candidatus Avelusimicrobium sp.]|uniref:S1 family peptidase n=1 Tax=Candidatus Avelusimicrobium sp. TaxID=3048833 RepID=UPI003F03F730
MRIWFLSFLLVCFSLPAYAGRPVTPLSSLPLVRRVEEGILRRLSAWRRKAPSQPAAAARQVRFLTPAVPWSSLQHVSAPKTVFPSLALPLDSEGFALGSGFVIRSASGRLYAVSAYHVTGSAGKRASVRLFRPDGRAVDYTGLTVSAGGSFGVNAPDVSLVELPASAGRFVRPLGVSAHPPEEGSLLFMWGRPYDAPGFELAKGLSVESAYGMKIALTRTEDVAYLEGMCGAPVIDENGLVTGIYGGRAGGNEELFAIDARKSLSWLLRNYENGRYEPYTFSVFGYPALELGRGESVGYIAHKTPDGSMLEKIDFPTYREALDAARLENAFVDVRSGDVIEFEVHRGRVFSHVVLFRVP